MAPPNVRDRSAPIGEVIAFPSPDRRRRALVHSPVSMTRLDPRERSGSSA